MFFKILRPGKGLTNIFVGGCPKCR